MDICTVTYTHYIATIQSQFEKDVNRSLAYYFNGNLIYIRTSVCTTYCQNVTFSTYRFYR